MTDREITPLGQLLEQGRATLGISAREAARRAGISESRWRQVVTGVQSAGGGVRVPVRPTVRTVAGMAVAVRVDLRAALEAADLLLSDGEMIVLMSQLTQPTGADFDRRQDQPETLDIHVEIDRISDLDIPAEVKLRLIRRVLDLYDEAKADRSGNQARHAPTAPSAADHSQTPS